MTGIKNATGDFIFALDGDDTYPSYQIREIIARMEHDGLDFVSCNRLPLKDKGVISRTRRMGIIILNIEVFLLYWRVLHDTLTGMWGIRGTVKDKLDLRMGDWNLSPEIKLEAMTNKEIRFAEHHIDHFVREKEPSKQAIWKTGVNHLLYILKRRFTQDNPLLKWFMR